MICSFHHWSQIQWSFILQSPKFFGIKFSLYFLVLVPVWKQVSGKKIWSHMGVSGKKILTQLWWAEKNSCPKYGERKKNLVSKWVSGNKLHHFFPLTIFETRIFFRSPVFRQYFFSAHHIWDNIFFPLTSFESIFFFHSPPFETRFFFHSPVFRQGLVLENIRKSWSWKM